MLCTGNTPNWRAQPRAALYMVVEIVEPYPTGTCPRNREASPTVSSLPTVLDRNKLDLRMTYNHSSGRNP